MISNSTRIVPEDARWLDLVTAHPAATIFQHPAWTGLLADCYGFKPMVVAIAGESGGLAAGLPVMEAAGLLRGRRLIALPFSDHCAPLALDQRRMPDLLAALDEYRREQGIETLEIRWPLDDGPGIYRGERVYLHETELTADPEALLARFHRTRVRQPLVAAQRAGIVVRRAGEERASHTFYELHLLTRSRLGVPVQPFRFFEMLGDRLIRRDLGFILVAEHAGRPAAAGVFLH